MDCFFLFVSFRAMTPRSVTLKSLQILITFHALTSGFQPARVDPSFFTLPQRKKNSWVLKLPSFFFLQMYGLHSNDVVRDCQSARLDATDWLRQQLTCCCPPPLCSITADMRVFWLSVNGARPLHGRARVDPCFHWIGGRLLTWPSVMGFGHRKKKSAKLRVKPYYNHHGGVGPSCMIPKPRIILVSTYLV